jgi:selenide,water dikinase
MVYRLTQYTHGGGCACKIPPSELEAILAGLNFPDSPDLLIGLDHGDDAAVVRIAGDRGVVVTADFFAPVVDDAYDFGRIAAANALSDVYAVGGEPLVAVNLLGWPRDNPGQGDDRRVDPRCTDAADGDAVGIGGEGAIRE